MFYFVWAKQIDRSEYTFIQVLNTSLPLTIYLIG